MAEFQYVMKQFDRMCWYYQRKRECPMGCPMNGVNISQCRKVAFEEPIVTEKTVMAWAAEHPEPVYPSYLEVFGWGHKKTWAEIKDILANPIPADIAHKLGIEPKEGTTWAR